MIPVLLLAACLPDVGTVVMIGDLHDEPYAEGSTIGGATLTTANQDEEVIGTATSDADGSFSVDVPQGVDFFLAVEGEGYVPTHFSAVGGYFDFEAGEGYPFIRPTDFVDDLRETFANCPTVNAEGAIVEGEVRIYIANAPTNVPPFVSTATVRVFDSVAEEAIEACYLDDDGVSLAPGVYTGTTGRFAVFGVHPGLVAVEVVYEDPGGDTTSTHPQFLVQDGGIVSMYPAWAYSSG